MYKYSLFLLLVLCSCNNTKHDARMKELDDSSKVLMREIDNQFMTIVRQRDSLLMVVRERDQMIYLTFRQAHKYAAIVKKNPSQSVFIVGWIDRAFNWLPGKRVNK